MFSLVNMLEGFILQDFVLGFPFPLQRYVNEGAILFQSPTRSTLDKGVLLYTRDCYSR